MDTDVLIVKGQKRTSSKSSNTKGSENIISNGSVIAVNEGQCMIIVEQGAIVDLCSEAGEYTYDKSTEPSIFCGGLGKGVKDSFKTFGRRFTFGGDTGKDQRVYFVNTKEILGNKYGTPSPVPFRVVDPRAGIDIDISIRCFGEYSYRITNPILFYTNVCGNVSEPYTRDRIDSQMKSELLTALQPAFAKISDMGIRYSSLPGHTTEIAAALNDVLSAKWRDLRGYEIVSFGVSSVKASEEDEAMLKEMQKTAAYTNPTLGAAATVAAQADAMRAAAANPNGAAMAFMGMGMAQNAGGVNAQNLYQMGAQQQAAAPAAPAKEGWKCACGAVNTGNFCAQCGAKKPEVIPEGAWKCDCGTVCTGNFCPQCGAKKPAAVSYKCGKCGWEPEDPANPPKFCPNCGDPFTEEDRI
jgi:membrane protease subunit (stomatin/prohibitin family)